MIKESDWKKFKKLKEAALEKFCAEVLADVQTAANRQNLSNHAKYLSVYKLIDNAEQKLCRMFDNHSRSKAPMQLMLLRNEGLIEEGELEGMSDELIKYTAPIAKNR